MGRKATEKGHENLIPLNRRTKAEQREIARQGGRASVASRRRAKTLKQTFDGLQKMTEHAGPPVSVASLEEAAGANLTLDERIALSVARKAINGDVKAAELYYRMRGGDFTNADKLAKAQIRKLEADTVKAGMEARKTAKELEDKGPEEITIVIKSKDDEQEKEHDPARIGADGEA